MTGQDQDRQPPSPAIGPPPAIGTAVLLARAREAMAQAHAPYSGFRVGVCLADADGRLFTGANVENAAWPQGWCAEASAIGAMVTAGGRRIAALLVIGGRPGPAGAGRTGPDPLCTPCGGCRQKIREFAGPDLPIHVAGPEGVRRCFRLDELLPFSFGPENLA